MSRKEDVGIMDRETVIDNLYLNYGKYGVIKEVLGQMVDEGAQNFGLSLDVIYSILRMSLASEFGECEYFTLYDVMAITGESREELIQRIEQYRKELIEAGENPDDYFKPIEPQQTAVYYFPDGVH